jgi:hypothetical protein
MRFLSQLCRYVYYMDRAGVRTYKLIHNPASATSSLALRAGPMGCRHITEHADHRDAGHSANHAHKSASKYRQVMGLELYSRTSVREVEHDFGQLLSATHALHIIITSHTSIAL